VFPISILPWYFIGHSILGVRESTPTDDYRAIIHTENWSLLSEVSSW